MSKMGEYVRELMETQGVESVYELEETGGELGFIVNDDPHGGVGGVLSDPDIQEWEGGVIERLPNSIIIKGKGALRVSLKQVHNLSFMLQALEMDMMWENDNAPF